MKQHSLKPGVTVYACALSTQEVEKIATIGGQPGLMHSRLARVILGEPVSNRGQILR